MSGTPVPVDEADHSLLRVSRWCLVGFAAANLWGQQTEPRRTFASPDKKFELRVPADYAIYSGSNITRGDRSYISLCRESQIVCIVYNGEKYQGTNFESAALVVNTIADRDRQSCSKPQVVAGSYGPDIGAPPQPAVYDWDISKRDPYKVVDGITFAHGWTGGGAMSHDLMTNLYRAFIHGACYEIDLNVTYSNYQVWAPGMIKEFTKRDQEQITADLMSIFDSFRVLH